MGGCAPGLFWAWLKLASEKDNGRMTARMSAFSNDTLSGVISPDFPVVAIYSEAVTGSLPAGSPAVRRRASMPSIMERTCFHLVRSRMSRMLRS
jgi:hypothetical protein